MNFVSIIIDEIALEGLDGITLPDLLTRLQRRKSEQQASIFQSQDEHRILNFIWNVVRVQNELQIFKLPETRNKLVIYNR